MAGKTIVITGAGSGIGARTAQSFAEAGASKIHILARREANLKTVKANVETLFPKTEVTYHIADVVESSALGTAAASIGKWDVLIANAGYFSARSPIATAEVEEWWRGWEVNVKGTFLTLRAFAGSANEGASVIGVSTAVVNFPAVMARTGSAYAGSKIGMAKVMEIFAAEMEGVLRVKTIHPGVSSRWWCLGWTRDTDLMMIGYRDGVAD